jgi:hypothetical protein
MAPTRLMKISRDFNLTIRKSFEWIRVINELANKERMKIREDDVYFSYELAFIKIFVAWEKFLQECFISYMTGASLARYKPKLYLKKVDRDHALKILSGTEDYPDWSKIDEVYTLAQLYFVNGEPFTLPLQQIETQFNDIKKVRNAIVHISSKAKEKFEGLLKAKISDYRPDISPGEFLGLTVKKGNTETFMEFYVSYLEAASVKIIPIQP